MEKDLTHPLAREDPELEEREKEEKEKKKKKGRISFIWILAEAIVLTAFILLIYFLSPYEVVSISTDSMAPTLPVGSISIAEQATDEMEYAVGDIITFSVEYDDTYYSRITHRIVSIEGDTIQTKGDHNDENDPFTIKRDQIRNKLKWINVFNAERIISK